MDNTEETRHQSEADVPATSRRHKSKKTRKSGVKTIPKMPLIIIAVILLVGLVAAAIIKSINHNGSGKENTAVVELKKKLPELKKAVDSKPNDPSARYNLGSAYYGIGDKDAAAREYEAAIKNDAKNPTYHNNLGNTYRDQKKYNEAIAEYKKAIELQPKHANAYSNMAFVQMTNLNDANAAADTYDKAAKAMDGAEKLSMLNMKGSALEKANRKDEAKAVYEEVLKAEPENAVAKANLERLNK